MFSKTALFVAAAFAASTFAGPGEYKCTVGTLMCCAQSQKAGALGDSQNVNGFVNVPVQDPNTQVGTGCTPITGIGKNTGADCTSGPTCCEKSYQTQGPLGLLGINCTPAPIVS